MRKLSLNLDALQVESFRTTSEEAARQGTVHAHAGIPLTLSGGEGYSTGDCVCACDTTYTQRAPECDPSAGTFCLGTACDPGL